MTTISLLLIILNFGISWKGFRDPVFFERFKFSVERLLVHKEYYRLITAGFLHTGWTHLVWNLVSFYAFSGSVELLLSPLQFLLVYFCCIIGGYLFALFVHRHHSDYSSVGASGGISGIIFGAIALFPGISVGFFFLPVSIPGWIFGLVYVLYSIYGMRNNRDGIGHEAHLAGSLIGMLMAIAMFPASLSQNYVVILLIAVPMMVFMFITITRPYTLLLDRRSKANSRYYTVEDRYNAQKAEMQKEMDRILEKISRKGMNSLTKKEKQLLKDYSKTVR